jgi:aspartate aminotransferase-like enzyme
LAGGQGSLSGKIFRIGHMGWVDEPELQAALHALQVELNTSPASGA